MADNEISKAKISGDEWDKVKISAAATRPNQKSAYGSGLSAQGTKELFDAPSKLIMEKHNALVDAVNNIEGPRESAEKARESAENARVAAEEARVDAEEARQRDEATRQSNEATRQSNEATRQSNEATRKSNENTRQSEENKRKQLYNDVLNMYNSASALLANAFFGQKGNHEYAGYFNNPINCADGWASTVFGSNNQIISIYTHNLQEYFDGTDFTPSVIDSNSGLAGFLAGANNVLSGYAAIGIGESNRVCGTRATAIGGFLRAYSAEQLVCGISNVPDYPENNDSDKPGKYVFIVGNGHRYPWNYANNEGYSNAFAVSWDGYAHVKEDIKFGFDDNAMTLTDKIKEVIAEWIGSSKEVSDLTGTLEAHEASIEALNKQIGAIDAALDGIIALQEAKISEVSV